MVVISFSTLGLFVLADVLFQLPRLVLALLLIVWLALSIAMLVYNAYRIAGEQRTMEGAARRVELAFPQLGSHLINLLQLTQSEPGQQNSFQAAAIEEAASRISDVPFHAAASRHTRWSRWRLGLQTPRDLAEVVVASLLVMIVAIAVHWAIPTWRSSADRLLTPWRYVPQTGSVQILEVTPGDGEVLAGSRLSITAKIADPQDDRPRAVLYTTVDGEKTQTRQMLPNKNRDAFTFTIPSVASRFEYQLQIGDSQSDRYHIGICESPMIRDVDVTYQFPELPCPARANDSSATCRPGGSPILVAVVRFVCSTELSRGYVQFPERQIAGQVGEDPHTLNVSIPMNEPTNFTVHLFNELGHTDSQPRVNNIRVAIDAPPRVQIAKPARETTAATGGELSFVVRAADDHGLTAVRLEAKPSDQPDTTESGKPERLHSWTGVSGSAATLQHKLALDPGRFRSGDSILVRAVAVDGRQLSMNQIQLAPQESVSPWVRITLISPQQEAAETMSRMESVTAQLWDILQTQIRARIATAELSRQSDFENALELAADIAKKQIRVQTRTVQLAKSLGSETGAEAAEWKQSLGQLASNQMLRAAQQSRCGRSGETRERTARPSRRADGDAGRSHQDFATATRTNTSRKQCSPGRDERSRRR